MANTLITTGGGSGGDIVLLNTTVVSSPVASVDFTSLITGTYKDYMLTFSNIVPSTSSPALSIRTSTNNGSTFASSGYTYAQAIWTHATPPVNAAGGSASSAEIRIDTASATSASGISGQMKIYDPLSSSTKTHMEGTHHSYTTSNYVGVISGSRDTAEANNSIRLLFNFGNINAGTFKLYGIK